MCDVIPGLSFNDGWIRDQSVRYGRVGKDRYGVTILRGRTEEEWLIVPWWPCSGETTRTIAQAKLPREWVDESDRFADHCQGAAMTELLMQPAPAGRNEYEVIIADGGQIVGRISLLNSAPAATPWMWVINFAFHEDREVTHGYEATREAAMQAFVRCWHREF